VLRWPTKIEYLINSARVDLSICPGNVAANTYATALAVGHKAAAIIAEDLGVPYSV